MSYINSIPTSVLGYGSQRQQFQSYDGILNSNEGDIKTNKIKTIQERIRYLDTKLKTLETLVSVFQSGGTTTGSVTVNNVKVSNGIIPTNATLRDQTNKKVELHTSNGTSIVMNGKPIRMGIPTDDSNVLTYSSYGGGIVDIKGNYGGSLCSNLSGTKIQCLDWGSGRVRSRKTFQSGTLTNYDSNGVGVVTFTQPFKYTPVVVALNNYDQYDEESWNPGYYIGQVRIANFMLIYDVTNTGFKCKGFQFNNISILDPQYFGSYPKIWNQYTRWQYFPTHWLAIEPTSVAGGGDDSVII